jgi:hypothetical protein
MGIWTILFVILDRMDRRFHRIPRRGRAHSPAARICRNFFDPAFPDGQDNIGCKSS